MAASEYPANWQLLVYGPHVVVCAGIRNWQLRTSGRSAADQALAEVMKDYDISDPRSFIIRAHTDWQDGLLIDREYYWDDDRGELVENTEKYSSRRAQ
ncbi:MAG TPA: hypothetical protein VMH40_20090 [Myxococcaceae bacterium]|nr:hypothetical protein [Myxococcaceae bacterium]